MGSKKEKLFNLWVHNELAPEIIINSKSFPDVKSGDILEIFHADQDHGADKHLLLQVHDMSSQAQLQISIAKHVADLFHLQARRSVVVRVVPPAAAAVDSLECFVKDQYLSRTDMWRLKMNTTFCVYEGMSLTYNGIKSQVQTVRIDGRRVLSGLVTDKTKWTFRSRSASCFVMIQVSREMWGFAPGGDLYWERCVNHFLRELFEQWGSQNTSHSVTIILFTRVFYNESSAPLTDHLRRSSFTRTGDGRLYQDFYKVVFYKEKHLKFEYVQKTLKREFIRFPASAGFVVPALKSSEEVSASSAATPSLGSPHGQGKKATPLTMGENSNSSEGNLLEAINLVLNVYDQHNFDRELQILGQSLIIVTPGTGVFQVDSTLANFTRKRLVDAGVGADIISLARPPLHAAPLFIFEKAVAISAPPRSDDGLFRDQNAHLSTTEQANSGPEPNADTIKAPFVVPHWLRCTFFEWKKPTLDSNFISRCERMSSGPQLPRLYDSPMRPFHPPESELEEVPRFLHPFRPTEYKIHDEKVFHIPTDAPVFQLRTPLKRRSTSKSNDALQGTKSEGEDDECVGAADPSTPLESSPGSWQRININLTGRRREASLSFSLGDLPSSQVQSISRGPVPSGDETPPYRSESLRASKSVLARRRTRRARESNPFKPPEVDLERADTPDERRWGHLYLHAPRSQLNVYARYEHTAPWFPSFVIPANLPLTTDFFPEPTDLETNYYKKPSTLTPNPDHNAFEDKVELLLRELIAQRLSQGFQLIIKEGWRHVAQTMKGRPGISYIMSMGDSYHVLVYHPGEENIQITQYTSKPSTAEPPPAPFMYKYQLMYLEREFRSMEVLLSHEQPQTYPWSIQDDLVCGYDDDEDLDMLKWWRIRFALVPVSAPPTTLFGTAALDWRKRLVSSFNKFMDALVKATGDENAASLDVTIVSSKETHGGDRIPELNSATNEDTDLLAATPPLQRSEKSGVGLQLLKRFFSRVARGADDDEAGGKGNGGPGKADGSDVTTSIRSAVIAAASGDADSASRKDLVVNVAAVMADPDSGLMMRSRGMFSRKTEWFLGSDAIDWMHTTFTMPSRAMAATLANRLLQQGLIRGTDESPNFEDSKTAFYRFVKQDEEEEELSGTAVGAPSRQGFESGRENEDASCAASFVDRAFHVPPLHSRDASRDLRRGGKRSLPATTFPSALPYREKKIEVSRGDRSEWLKLRYDKEYDPDAVYHLEMHWLICTGSAVTGFINMCERKARQCDLQFHQVPVIITQGMRTPPWIRSHSIELNLPRVSQREELGVQNALIKQFDFIPDKALPSAFLHRLAYATIRLVPGGFLWTSNPLAWTENHEPARKLLADFTTTCATRNSLLDILYPGRKTEEEARARAREEAAELAIRNASASKWFEDVSLKTPSVFYYGFLAGADLSISASQSVGED